MGAAPALIPNVTHTGFPGDDFSNNLFTDLAPLLALFGDQMTKQFLGMSMGWLDNAMLAICPVGILTVMVSAIRIGGTSKLKTLIGRYESATHEQSSCTISWADTLLSYSARESRSTAELELLSATSGEVCEMWSGSEIVRVAGQPATFQYILNKGRMPETIMTLSEALKQNLYCQNSNQTDVEIPSVAPNLTLNVRGAIPLSRESLTICVIGTIMQVMTLVLSAFTVYLWSWRAGSNMISSYGFPCYFVGTILLTFGLLGCARVIQRSSRVHELIPRESADALPQRYVSAEYQPLCVQRACTVDDKHFPSYAIFHPEGQSAIKVSRSNGQDYNLVTSCSTVVALIGYVCQFTGLRAMHWSVALMQLGATLTMTCARAFIGRGLANPPIYQPLPIGNEAAGIAYLLREAKAWELVTGTSKSIKPAHATLSYVEYIWPEFIVPPPLYESGETLADPNLSNDLIMTAKSIGKTVPMEDSTLLLAQRLVSAIGATMKICSRRHADGVLDGNMLDCNEHCWAIQPSLRMNEGTFDHLPITMLYSSSSPGRVKMSKEAQENTVLTADSGTMTAIISLWLVVLGHRYPLSKARAQDENETARRPQYYRIISNNRILVPLGNAIGKWLSPQTPLLTNLSLFGRSLEERQAKNAPIFGMYLSSRYSRFKGLAE